MLILKEIAATDKWFGTVDLISKPGPRSPADLCLDVITFHREFPTTAGLFL